MPHYEFKMLTADGLTLLGQGWEPDEGIKAAVCLIHGLGEHSGRYERMAVAFNSAGYALITFDLRGHGRSEGRRGHAPSYHALMNDIAGLLHEASARYPDIPRFLYGHSLGGNLTIHYVLRRKVDIAGVVVTSPLLRLTKRPPAWKTALLKILRAAHINISMSSGLEDAALTRDFHEVRLYQNDPLVHDRVTPRLAIDMLRNGEWNLKHAAEFPQPLLLMHGEADRITSVEATVEFAAHLNRKCTLEIWDGFYHELHNEPEKEQVFAFVMSWMDGVIG